MKNYSNELERLQSLHDTIYNVVPSDNKEKHIDLLNKYLTNSFVRITHASAVELINSQDVLPKMKYDEDLSSASEKYIVDYYKMPVIVMKYPKNVKAFYMPVVNETFEESRGVEHVDSCDILVPDLGELVGGSKRIDNAEDLEKRIDELNKQLASINRQEQFDKSAVFSNNPIYQDAKTKIPKLETDINGKEQQIVTLEDYYAPDMNASVVG